MINTIMDRKRLLELAGVTRLGSNMSNPSHEPATDVPDNKVEIPANLDTGEENKFDDDTFDKHDEMIMRSLENILPQVKELAAKGLNIDDIEEARNTFENILELLGEEIY